MYTKVSLISAWMLKAEKNTRETELKSGHTSRLIQIRIIGFGFRVRGSLFQSLRKNPIRDKYQIASLPDEMDWNVNELNKRNEKNAASNSEGKTSYDNPQRDGLKFFIELRDELNFLLRTWNSFLIKDVRNRLRIKRDI